MEARERRRLAKERWLMLKNALLHKTMPFVPSRSLRLHNSLPFFSVQEIAQPVHDGWQYKVAENCAWQRYTCDYRISNGTRPHILIKNPPREVATEDLLVEDNTGNICIWASEQAMAYYCIKNMYLFAHKAVIEIGGGFSCLAGSLVAKYGNPKKVFLSDGNEKALANVSGIVDQNALKNTELLQLCWDDFSTFSKISGAFDYLLCADCLFKDAKREQLAQAIFNLLKPCGEGLIFAPKRGKTFEDFVIIAKGIFGSSYVTVISNYDKDLWEIKNAKRDCPSYDEGIHYPLLLKLKKCDKFEAILTAAHYA